MRSSGKAVNWLMLTLSRRSRLSKARRLESLIPEGSTVLVVGVEALGDPRNSNLVELTLAARSHVTAVVYDAETPSSVLREAVYGLIRADGRRLPFLDSSFDYVLSNAVLEHVGGFSDIRDFLRESRRVARHAAIHTTPNRWFPVETHTGIPFAHWLPRRTHKIILRTKRYTFSDQDTLLSRTDLVRLGADFGATTGGPASNWPLTLAITLRGNQGRGL